MRFGLLGAIVMLAVLMPMRAAAADNAGAIRVVTESGSSDQRASGFGQTGFSLRPPDGAVCPGDSANDGYRVQAFIVPAATDPGTVRYKSIGPANAPGYALYDTFTRPYVQMQTQPNAQPGHPARLFQLPTLSFAVFPPGYLQPGRYHVGIACTLYNATKRYWDTDVDLTRAPNDKPAEIHWSLADRTLVTSHASPLRWIIVAGGVAAALVAIVLWRRAPRAAATRRENP